MTVIVAGKLIQRIEQLSELARQTLGFIDGGAQWLAWAMLNPTARYELTDESTLLADVQQRLHASPLVLLPGLGLWVGPVKLMSLGSANVRTLGLAETGDASAPVAQQMRRILAEHKLVDVQQLRSASEWLVELGVAAAPVFQARDLHDSLALHALVTAARELYEENPAQLWQEAAAFAVQQARTVPEFCDYFQVYLALSQKMNALGGGADNRFRLADQALQTLLPLALGAVDCLQLPDGLWSPPGVENGLHNWLTNGHKLGFARLSQAVLQMVTQTSYTTETGSEASRLFDLYFNTAQSFLGSNGLKLSSLGQDGASLTFTLQNTEQQATLQVSAARKLSLLAFGNSVAH